MLPHEWPPVLAHDPDFATELLTAGVYFEDPVALEKFLVEKMKTLGTAACPPYHLAFVVGGTSAEACLKTVKIASTGYLDHLPTPPMRRRMRSAPRRPLTPNPGSRGQNSAEAESNNVRP